ncbi:nuclear pore complex protein DDB_G0274915 [Drosophila ficusphila]|uniref:nuclear pore complex protein DDB_G0274915 n=1 Tax=Drosophila ficusphila TaxID=30025 RepID=UPI001C8AF904|nr:nuclear pore complex protein DDB_G0274915 [Drosophila ficusphila]
MQDSPVVVFMCVQHSQQQVPMLNNFMCMRMRGWHNNNCYCNNLTIIPTITTGTGTGTKILKRSKLLRKKRDLIRRRFSPRSKWHSTSKPNPAKPGPRANQAAATHQSQSRATATTPPRATPRATHQIVLPTRPLNSATSTRRATENPRDIILTIREPQARVQQAPTYEATIRAGHATSQDPITGATNSSPNCCCSQRRTRPTERMRDLPTSTITTIPIVIDSKPNPRILLIRVPTSNSNNCNNNCNSNSSNNSSNSNSSGTEHRAPRTRVIRIPFLPGSVPTRPPSNHVASPATSPLVNPTGSARRSRISTCLTTGIPTSPQQPETVAGLATTTTTAMVNQTVPVSTSKPQTQTLAAMAGILLPGADEPPFRQDMSGAMPTATVEEIDVPVFIDEYLQDIEATSSTCSSENGKEIFTETDILDFDINMFAQDLELEGKKIDPNSPAMDEMNNDNINNDFLGMDDVPLASEEATMDMSSWPMDDGIDFNQGGGPDLISSIPQYQQLSAMLTSSQDPLLCTFSQATSTSSNTKYIIEEPHVPDMASCDGDSLYPCSQESLGFGLGEVAKPSGSFASSGDDVDVAIPTPIIHPVISVLKRSAPAPVVEEQPLKRSRLALQINSQPTPTVNLSTPEIIDHVLDFDKFMAGGINTSTNNTSNNIITITEAIVEDLRSAEEETTNDFSPPNTPRSNYSNTSSSAAPTCQTGFGGFLTAPASPAFSVASTSQFSPSPAGGTANGKRKRGRPAKEHADGPDPELMSRMNGDERKAYQDRIKNNEASRVSRRKTKKREEEEKSAEDQLVAENLRLRALADEVAFRERKFKKYLMERQRKNSTYIKQEQH